ncbi:MAG: class I SAM-dependent methyltransferase [Acidimicrobiales bacterium]|nr:class I SAM-dependent methyltransferase [Acidimicrobiales bacterium]
MVPARRSLPARLRGRAARSWRSAATAVRHPQWVRLHGRLADCTLLPAPQFCDNLTVARLARQVPGDLVECGTWRGGMIAALAATLPGRHCVLFDSFAGLPDAQDVDGPAAVHWSQHLRDHDNCSAEERWVHEAMGRVGQRDYDVRAGWFDETVGAWATMQRPIAVLRLDADWYDGTRLCLDALMPLVVPGGVVIVDDYFDWDGASRAVHDHLAAAASPERLRTSPADEFAYLIRSGPRPPDPRRSGS